MKLIYLFTYLQLAVLVSSAAVNQAAVEHDSAIKELVRRGFGGRSSGFSGGSSSHYGGSSSHYGGSSSRGGSSSHYGGSSSRGGSSSHYGGSSSHYGGSSGRSGSGTKGSSSNYYTKYPPNGLYTSSRFSGSRVCSRGGQRFYCATGALLAGGYVAGYHNHHNGSYSIDGDSADKQEDKTSMGVSLTVGNWFIPLMLVYLFI